MNWYCDSAPGSPIHGPYHDDEYGLPRQGEAVLFELLALEIFQAGLSWELILKKRPTTFKAFDGFDVDTVAAYGEKDIKRLLGDAGIIRNKLKINSIIENAKRIQAMRESHGGFAKFIEAHHPMPKSGWVKLFKKTFKFTGGEIVNEFLMSLGYLPGAHREDCPAYARIVAEKPQWMRVDAAIFDA
ncbi:MAG: DNA-3-methyladenine glycosylase I [Rhodospirillales bacterium]|nr:DNA-3-methyladenine glycosylase I [Rhodospirillales bacterium]